MKQKLASITYKNFKFPYNPASTSYKIDRTYIKHKYPQLSGNELEDFGPNACVISGSGEFFGKDAYSNWTNLVAEFKKNDVGTVSHPIFTDITRGLMVSLQGNVDALENYIKYSFEIIADTEPVANECLGKYISVISGTGTSTSSNGGSNGIVGSASNSFVHTVVSGECLSVICARYATKYGTTISWKKIAEHNNMKNPNLIYPGDKIKIYYPT